MSRPTAPGLETEKRPPSWGRFRSRFFFPNQQRVVKNDKSFSLSAEKRQPLLGRKEGLPLFRHFPASFAIVFVVYVPCLTNRSLLVASSCGAFDLIFFIVKPQEEKTNMFLLYLQCAAQSSLFHIKLP